MNTTNPNIIYNYPKTSATECCFDGKLNKFGVPTNMSVTNCNFEKTDLVASYINTCKFELTTLEFRSNIIGTIVLFLDPLIFILLNACSLFI